MLFKCPFSDAELKHKDIGQQSSVAKSNLLFQDPCYLVCKRG